MTAYERVHHVADAWTVGRLRAALAGLPDDAPLTVAVPVGSPGTGEYAAVADPDRVVSHAGHGTTTWPDDRGPVPDTHVTITPERPTGVYERPIREDRQD